MTPNQARAARAMLNLDMKSVCKLATVGKRTLTEFESGRRSINNVTMSKIKAFYISRGISFGNSVENEETVTFHGMNIKELSIPVEVREKTEYIDYLNAKDVDSSIESIIEILNDTEQIKFFSRRILLMVMSQENLNQKQLSAALECSPAFVNAIIVGKKFMPPSMADRLSSLYRNIQIDIREAVAQERRVCAELGSFRQFLEGSKGIFDKLYSAGTKGRQSLNPQS